MVYVLLRYFVCSPLFRSSVRWPQILIAFTCVFHYTYRHLCLRNTSFLTIIVFLGLEHKAYTSVDWGYHFLLSVFALIYLIIRYKLWWISIKPKQIRFHWIVCYNRGRCCLLMLHMYSNQNNMQIYLDTFPSTRIRTNNESSHTHTH